MRAERLLQIYDRVSEAPDAIPRLRSFILDLAIRGKLVEQHQSDEPAQELGKRISGAISQLLTGGQARKPRQFPPLEPEELLFELPSGWAWSQISRIGLLSPRNDAEDDLVASFVPMPNISADYGVSNNHEPRRWSEIKKGYTHFAEGDVGLAKITPCFENGKSTVFRNLTGGIGSGTTELHIVRPFFVSPDYIVAFLKSPFFIGHGIPRMTGTAGQKRVPLEYFAASPFPLPPLEEQHRIVAKIDELMGLCDSMEVEREKRETTRDRLTTASVSRLTAPDVDEKQFKAHADFAIKVLPELTTRPDQIKMLRQTILDLAVRGKLVEQDPNDEPASEFLKKLPSDRANPQKKLDLVTAVGASRLIPESWIWLPLGNLISKMDAGWSPQCESGSVENEKEWGVLKTTAVQALDFDARQNKRLPPKLRPRPEYEPSVGDILVTRAGPKNRVGVSCVVDTPCSRLMISDKLIRVRLLDGLSPHYVALTLNAGYTFEQLEVAKSGMAVMQMNISQAKLSAVPIPLPPLAEQQRIVAKVNELLAQCRALEQKLAFGRETMAELLEALLKRALEPLVSEAA